MPHLAGSLTCRSAHPSHIGVDEEMHENEFLVLNGAVGGGGVVDVNNGVSGHEENRVIEKFDEFEGVWCRCQWQ